MQDCLTEAYPLETNGDLVIGLILEREALASCNVDKRAIRAWNAEVKAGK